MNPADNYATVAASPRPWDHRGRALLVSRLSPSAAGEMLALIADEVPDPRKAARAFMEGHDLAMQKYIYDKACQEAKSWPPDIDSPEGLRVLMGRRGVGLLVYLALHRNHPEVSRDSAAALGAEMTMDEVMALLGLMLPEGTAGPKSAGPDGAGTAGPSAPGPR